MKVTSLKLLAGIVSVALAGGVWMGLATLLFASPIHLLQALAVYISHLSFIGWLLFGLLSIIFYQVLSRFVPPG